MDNRRIIEEVRIRVNQCENGLLTEKDKFIIQSIAYAMKALDEIPEDKQMYILGYIEGAVEGSRWFRQKKHGSEGE